MDLDELISRLQELQEDWDAGSWDIRIAQQPRYPLLGFIDAISIDSDKKEIYIASDSAQHYGKVRMWDDYSDLAEEEEGND